jgi:hypothetical protein
MTLSIEEYNSYVLMKFQEQMHVLMIPKPRQAILYRALQDALEAAVEFKALADPLERSPYWRKNDEK